MGNIRGNITKVFVEYVRMAIQGIIMLVLFLLVVNVGFLNSLYLEGSWALFGMAVFGLVILSRFAAIIFVRKSSGFVHESEIELLTDIMRILIQCVFVYCFLWFSMPTVITQSTAVILSVEFLSVITILQVILFLSNLMAIVIYEVFNHRRALYGYYSAANL